MAKGIYAKSMFSKPEEVLNAFRGEKDSFFQSLEDDFAYTFSKHLKEDFRKLVLTPYRSSDQEIDRLQQEYMRALLEAFPERRFYPDANRTLRVSFGKVEGYTNLNGEEIPAIFQLKDALVATEDLSVFPAAFMQLAERKQSGRIPTSFLASNHTVSGSSGSPVLNAEGKMVGLNADRNQEGKISNYYYDPAYCRNISVDIRYIMFLLDQYADMKYVLEELK